MSFRKSFSQYLNTRKLHPVGIRREEQDERIFVCSEDNERDITDSHALITLNPFSIAINAARINSSQTKRAFLKIKEGENRIGELILKLDQMLAFPSLALNLYVAELPSGAFPITGKIWNSLLLAIKNKTDKRSKRFVVPPRELLKLFVYTMKPRPVYLVSVKHEKGLDVFPVDILGKVSEDQVLFAVRSSSPAIPFILHTRKVCASAMPYAKVRDVYRFGGHHPGGILPQQLNDISFITSQQLNIPIPEFAAAVQELAVEETFTKGIHTQFVSRMMNHYQLTDELQLAHTPWFNKKYFQGKFNEQM